MENVTDALYMAFGVLIFVLALSIAVSSFSLVRLTASGIMDNSDNETQYTYLYGTTGNVEGGGTLETSRIVGKETVIPTLYRAFIENYTVRFYNSNGTALNIIKIKTEHTDTNGKKTYTYDPTNEIDLQNGGIGTHDQAKNFITALVTGKLSDLFDGPNGRS